MPHDALDHSVLKFDGFSKVSEPTTSLRKQSTMKPGSSPSLPEDRRERAASASGPRRFARILALLVMVAAVYVLHQDFWNWQRIEPLRFGFLPVGLAYHVAYSILAALMMAVLVRFAWPAHLEQYEPGEPSAPGKHGEDKS